MVVARPSAREASFATLEGAADALLSALEKSLPLSLLAFLLSLPIHLYRWILSPLLPRACRFHPSCSAYALGALQQHGPVHGFWLALRRLGRCNPFNPGGLDPVPPRPGRILNSVENNSQKRTAVAFGLIFLLTAVYMTWFAPTTSPHAAAVADAGTVASSAPGPAPVSPPPLPITPPSAGAPPTGPAVRTLEVSRKLIHYVFSTEGAGLVSAKLQGDKTREQRPLSIGEGWAQVFGKPVPEGPQMDLAQPVAGAPLPLSVELAGDSAIPATLRYSAEEGDHRITFVGRTESWEVTKEVSWVDDGFELSTRVTLRNLTTRPLTGELVLPYGRAIDPVHEEKPSFFGGVGNVSDAACFVKDAYEHETVKDKLETKEHSGPVRWLGIDQQYFLSAIFPLGARSTGGACSPRRRRPASRPAASRSGTTGAGRDPRVRRVPRAEGHQDAGGRAGAPGEPPADAATPRSISRGRWTSESGRASASRCSWC